MIIVRADYSDLAAILTLQKLSYREAAERYNDFNIPPLTQSLDNFQSNFQHYIILKAVVANHIVGSIRAYSKENTAYIERVIVHPDFQNQGIGKRMMKEIETYFPEISRYELFTGYKDEKNLAFYQKLGYSKFKEERYSEQVCFVFLEKWPIPPVVPHLLF